MMTLILHLEILVAVETEMVLEVGLELGVDLMVMEGGGDLVVMEEVGVEFVGAHRGDLGLLEGR